MTKTGIICALLPSAGGEPSLKDLRDVRSTGSASKGAMVAASLRNFRLKGSV